MPGLSVFAISSALGLGLTEESHSQRGREPCGIIPSDDMTRWHNTLNRARRDDGFTISELAVALGIFSVALLLLTAVIANNLRGVLVGKQRSVATAAAQDVIESTRSLKWESLGLLPADPTLPQNGGADPLITQNPPGSGVWTFGGEKLAYADQTSGAHPLSPHISAPFKRGATSLTRTVYVTAIDRNADGVDDIKRVTVMVTWAAVAVASADDTVRLSTLISPNSVSGTGKPLSASADVKNGSVSMTSTLGSATPVVLRHQLSAAEANGSKVAPVQQGSCSSRAGVIERTGGSTFGPSALTTLADDDSLTTAPLADGPKNQPVTGSPIPGDISPFVVQSSVPGLMNCFSSVLGDDGIQGTGVDDLFSRALVHGATPPGGSTVSTTFRLNAASAVPALGNVDMFDLADPNTEDVTALTDEGPIDTLVATGTQRHGRMRFSRVIAPSASPPIDASLGLLQVEAFTAQGTATGKASGAPSDGSATATNPTMRFWVYDPGLQITIGCTSRSVSPAGYCIIDRVLNLPISFTATLALPVNATDTMRYTVRLNGGPASTSTMSGSSGVTWRAQIAPLTANVDMCVTTQPDCADPAGRRMDLRTEISLGSILTQVSAGFSS